MLPSLALLALLCLPRPGLQSPAEAAPGGPGPAPPGEAAPASTRAAGFADPIADPRARKGGSIAVYLGDFPKSFNYYLDNNTFSQSVFYFLYDTMITLHPMDLSPVPGLAASWEVSADKRTFTFRLDPAARWSDGRPVTADDVLFTYDVLMDPANLTSIMRVSLSRFEKPRKLDELTVRFRARSVHWENLVFFEGFAVLPRRAFEGRDFNKQNFEFPVVSGPYRVKEVRKGRSVELRRRPDWWAADRPMNRGKYNFDAIRYKTVAEDHTAFELFKKGELDLFPVHLAKLWHKQTGEEAFLRNWIVKQRVFNSNPPMLQGFVMNLRRPLFRDLRVRRALAHALDRDILIRKLMFNEYFQLSSYYPDLYASPRRTPFEPAAFDLRKARALLREAGWSRTDEDGWLVKDGRRFEFTILNRDKSSERYHTLYQEALRRLGIKAGIELVSMSTWFKRMDSYDFDMTWSAWAMPVLKDPEASWSSRHADEPAGNNTAGFKDPRADAIIERLKPVFDAGRRNAMLRELDRILVARSPYVLLWSLDNVRLLYWNKFGRPPAVLSKYGDENSALAYWWHDRERAARLEAARRGGAALPPEPPEVRFADVLGR